MRAFTVGVLIAVRLLLPCTAGEDVVAIPREPDSCEENEGSVPAWTSMDTQTLQVKDVWVESLGGQSQPLDSMAHSTPAPTVQEHKLNSPVPAGQTIIELDSEEGLAVGDRVEICDVDGYCEVVGIYAVQPAWPEGSVGRQSVPTITLSHPLNHNFSSNSIAKGLAVPTPAYFLWNDPHLTSINGDKFDVNQPDEYVLLRAPPELAQSALLEMRGVIAPEEKKPCGLYVKAVTLSGTWFGGAIVRVRPLKRNDVGSNRAGNMTEWPFSMQVSPNGSWKTLADFTGKRSSEALTDMVKITAEQSENFGGLLEGQSFIFHIGKIRRRRPASIAISQAMHQALNVDLKNIQALGHDTLGGLLGTEKHSKEVEQFTEDCKAYKASKKAKSIKVPGSHASPDASKLSASWF